MAQYSTRSSKRAVSCLRPLAKARLELLEREQAELEHLRVGCFLERFQHVSQGNPERDVRHQLVLDQLAEEDAGDPQLLVGVLGEESILVEEVVNHAREYLLLPVRPETTWREWCSIKDIINNVDTAYLLFFDALKFFKSVTISSIETWPV